LDKIDVVNVKATNLPKENFEAFYRQKPNRKFLRKIDFYVWVLTCTANFSLQYDPAPRRGETQVTKRAPDYFL
jgi:hypothetical protein